MRIDQAGMGSNPTFCTLFTINSQRISFLSSLSPNINKRQNWTKLFHRKLIHQRGAKQKNKQSAEALQFSWISPIIFNFNPDLNKMGAFQAVVFFGRPQCCGNSRAGTFTAIYFRTTKAEGSRPVRADFIIP